MKEEKKRVLCERCGFLIEECRCVCPFCGEAEGCTCCVGYNCATGG